MDQLQNQTFGSRERYAQAESAQQWGALIGGSALAIYGLTRGKTFGLALAAAGGTLAYLGATSHKPRQQPTAKSSILLNCTPQEAYAFWHDFENLPRFMRHLESVNRLEDGTLRWVAIGPMGSKIEWKAEIVKDEPNQIISWRSQPGSDLDMTGYVEFSPAPAQRGTLVTAEMHFYGVTGTLGQKLARALGKSPKFLMTQDLRRFKALVETGEIPTIEGQTHGPRSRLTAAMRMANPDMPLPRQARATDVLDAMRRTA
jgi:uncharacterized membrane protein